MLDKVVIDTLEKARQYCQQLDLPYRPILIDIIPETLKTINNFIEQRGKRDLPFSQFDDRVDKNNPKDLVEMSGILVYRADGNICEISYTPPEESKVVFDDNKWAGTSTRTPVLIDVLDIPRDSEIFIDYHSHPIGPGELSPGDVKAIGRFNMLLERVKVQRPLFKSHYFSIFSPQNNITVWYQIVDRNK